MTNAFLILPAMCIPFKHSEMGNTVGNHWWILAMETPPAMKNMMHDLL
jgi:hypothetical protein